MAIIMNEQLECGCQLAVWKITENLDNLLSAITLTKKERETLDRFTS